MLTVGIRSLRTEGFRTEGDALGESSPVHEALLKDEGSGPSAGRSSGARGAGTGGRRHPNRRTGRGPGISLAGSGLLLRSGQGVELLLPPDQPVFFGDGDGADRGRRGGRGGPEPDRQAGIPRRTFLPCCTTQHSLSDLSGG